MKGVMCMKSKNTSRCSNSSGKIKYVFPLIVTTILVVSGLYLMAEIDVRADPSDPIEVWVDDDFTSSTPGWHDTHFDTIWDGIENDKWGGTAHIIKLKRSGLPSSHPQLQQRLQNLQSGPICHILTPSKNTSLPDKPFSKKTIYSDYWSGEDLQQVNVSSFNRDFNHSDKSF